MLWARSITKALTTKNAMAGNLLAEMCVEKQFVCLALLDKCSSEVPIDWESSSIVNSV